jgi:hypothetical protein
MELNFILSGLIDAAPSLIIWIAAVILSCILMKRNRGSRERLLVIGSGVMLASSILSIFQPLVTENIKQGDLSNIDAAKIMAGIGLFLNLIKLSGIVCLFCAVWKKFNEMRNSQILN